MPTEVKGVIELRKALRKFAPDLSKETQKELRAALKPIVAKSRGFLPDNEKVPSGWLQRENSEGSWSNRFYDQATARRGITFKTTPSKTNRKGWRSVASILNTNAGGAIYETAGRKTKGAGGASLNPNAGQQFINILNQSGELKNADNQKRVGRHSQKAIGRAMFRAVAEDQGKTTAAVLKALGKAEDKFKAATS
jgi:hypothetical protein